MLKFLRVKNFALMEELALNFEPGLTVITGETGAGKSMIVEAIAALCGEKMDEVSIRTGKEYAEITGIFEINSEVLDLLKKYNIEANEELIIRRRIERGKRQFAYLNDQIVSLSRLKEITMSLIDLVGQYENQSLFNVSNHLKLLDRFAHIENRLAEYQKIFDEHKKCQLELDELLKLQNEKEQKLENLKYDIDEIERANLKPKEEEALIEEKNLLQTSEKRANLIDEIIPRLYEAESSAYENLALVINLVEELGNLDTRPEIKNLKSILENSISNIEEVYRQLVDYREHIDFSRERFEEVMERLDLIGRLKKKYRKDINEIIEYLKVAREEIARLEQADIAIEKLQQQLQLLSKDLQTMANELSKKRKTAAKIMEKEIIKILSRLGMERAKFQINFAEKPIDETGMDNVEFYISTNPGEELKPLHKVGSGGEISRMTLGLKTILSEADHIPIIIFDEVDTGIGGRIAEAVGELLFNLSKDHQVICITHLPQISIFADNHILVKKEIKKDTTQVNVLKLDEEMRKMEIARMLGGKEITKKTIEHAEEILQKRRRSE
ncbi:MAG: DNA repair protein RecN [candidate division WOR-3 bacterium]